MRTEEDLRTELEAAGPGETPPVPELDTLIGRGRRARLRRRLVVGTAGVAVIAVAAAPVIWLTSRGPAVENAPVLGAPAPTPTVPGPVSEKPTPAPPGSEPNCSVYWVCMDPAAKPVTKPLAGAPVRIGQSVGGRPIVVFGTRGSLDGAGPQNHVYVYAGWLDRSGRPVAGGQILGTDPVTAELEPLPMYRNDTGTEWAIAGQLKGSVSKLTAILPDGRRVDLRNRSTKVVPGYTHFWAGGRAPSPVRVEAVTPTGTVKCDLDRCSGIG
jgi:hypothetical protein